MIQRVYEDINKKIDDGLIFEFDEILNVLKEASDNEKKIMNPVDFLNKLSTFESDEEIYNEIDSVIKFASSYGYSTPNDLIEKLKGLLNLKGDELKNAIKKLIEDLSMKDQGYGYPQENKDKEQNQTKKNEDENKDIGDFEEETINLFDQEICQAGDYGKNGKVTEDDLKAIVKNFNELKDKVKVPLTVDHIDSGPAYGWLVRLKKVGDKLLGDFEHVPSKFADLIRSKRFLRYSPEIYMVKPAGIEENVEPPILKAISILGVKQPSMKGLKNAEVMYNSEPGVNYILFSNTEEVVMNEKIENLENEVSKLKREKTEIDVQKFMEKLESEGKITPAMRDVASKILIEANSLQEPVVKFSENEKLTLYDSIKKLLEMNEKVVSFSEINQSAPEVDENDPDIKLDKQIQEVIKKFSEKGIEISYAKAKSIVENS